MLINLTHHPFAAWPDEQKRAVERYGNITDLPFPRVAPEAGAEDVAALAEQYIVRCTKLMAEKNDKQNAVHIMGEMTFVYQFVRQATERGFTCLASTTRRAVDWDETGNKVSRFEFIRFRKYERRFVQESQP